ncbi:DUF4232 domain-containing protein [Nonomuraea terrae]|uniref:DUF4232 domain-containing protein n=1 Tax=Nonomuraea terrae TaxID=2530383 RepID=UPI001404462F|nr:DUF4232 domain-containing protein [Nonomuraea terrae]
MTVISAVRALCVVLCLAGCGVEAATAPSPTVRDPHHPLASPPPTVWSPSPAPTCSGPGTIVAAGLVDAAMGLRAQTVTLTNCGDEVRTVRGYPRVRLLDGDGEPLDIEIDEGAQQVTTAVKDPGPRTVTLRPGRSAMFAVVWRNTYTDISRPPALGTTLVVRGHRVPGNVDLGSTGVLGVTAWEPVKESGT